MNEIAKITKNKFDIIVSSEKLIHEDIITIKNFLKKLFVVIGVSKANMPTQVEFDFLADKIRTTFRNYTLADIELAFDLAIEDKINYNLNLFDKPFSIQFLSGLMKKYKEYRNKSKEYLAALEPPKEEIIPSKEDVMEDMKRGVLELFEGLKDGTATFDDCYWYYYNYLDRDLDLIKASSSEKKNAIQWAKEYLLGVKKEQAKSLKDLIQGLTANDEQAITNTAKERVLMIYLVNLISRGKELKQII